MREGSCCRPLFAAGSAITAALVVFPARADTMDLRHRLDRADITMSMGQNPHARELLERGEAELAAGRVQAAAELFGQAMQAAPKSSVAARRSCQALVELGRRDEALSACQKALSLGGTVFDQRAVAAAMMAGVNPPTTEELTVAMRLAGTAKERMEHQPWGYAMECDVARRLGDENLIRRCADELQRVAPGHYETERALALAGRLPGSFGRWLGWIALFAACVLTAAHAVLRVVRPRLAAPASVLFVSVGLLLGAMATPALAAEGNAPAPTSAPGNAPPSPADQPGGGFSKWGINHDDPQSSLPTNEQRNHNPVEFGHHLIDLTDAAEAAIKRGEHAKAIEYYKALAKAVPDTSRPFSKICESYLALDNRQKALEYCTAAIALPGARVVDHGLYATVMLAKPGKLNEAELADLSQVVEHLQKQDAKKDVGPKLAAQIQCQVGLRNEDVKWLEACVDGLSDEPADDPRVLTHRFALALARKDAKEAQAVIDVARHTSMPPEAIHKMEQSVWIARPLWRRALGDWRVLVSAAALIALGGVVRFAMRQRQRTGLRPA